MTLGIIVNGNNEKSSKQYAIWDEFLKKWPISKIKDMTLEEYTSLIDGDREHSFCTWLESDTTDLGSIWGGSAFKFGIFARKDETEKLSNEKHRYNDKYAWLNKYGTNQGDAFPIVRNLIYEIAKYAKASNLEAIENVDFGNGAVQWKIAFLYQDRSNPTILPIYKKETLQSLTNKKYNKISDYHKELIKHCPEDFDLLEYGAKLWSEGIEMKSNEVGTELIELLKTIYPTDLDSLKEYNNGMVLLYPALKVLIDDETSRSNLETDNDHEKSDYYLDNVEQDDNKVENGQLFLKREALVTRVASFLGFGGNENSIKKPQNKNHTMQSFSANVGVNQLLKQIFIRLKIFNDNGTRCYKIASKQFSDIKNAISKFEENNGGAHKTAELIKACYHAVRNKALGFESEEVSEINSEAKNDNNEKIALNRILYGPPGTGKTFITAQKAVEICIGECDEGDIRNVYNELCKKEICAGDYTAKQITFTTFHQSMGYEDFVEGLRPEALENGAGFTLRPKAGIFKKVCKVAEANPNKNFVIIIDEINRGNVSKIFGELITLLEEDKRIGNKYPLYVMLPYSQEEFSVPKNVYIIGTMNTADRSIAQIDTALRRRFEFTEMMPEYNLDGMGHLEDDNNIHKGKLLEAINHKIIEKYDRDHQIGHAYLINIESEPKLDKVFRYKIIPLLQEYFYDNLQTIHDILGDGFIKSKDGDNYQIRDKFDYKKLLEIDNAGVNQSETEHNDVE